MHCQHRHSHDHKHKSTSINYKRTKAISKEYSFFVFAIWISLDAWTNLFITSLIAPVITREVIMENEIVDLNVLFNLNTIFQVLFTINARTINAAFIPKVHCSFCTCHTVGFFLGFLQYWCWHVSVELTMYCSMYRVQFNNRLTNI